MLGNPTPTETSIGHDRQRQFALTFCVRSLGRLLPAAAIFLSAAGLIILFSGCSSPESSNPAVTRAEARLGSEIPSFFSSPPAGLLTSGDGFIGHVTAVLGADKSAPLSGEMAGRGSRLFFAPETRELTGKQTRGLTFIWNAADNRGFILNDPMQAYAPILGKAQATNLIVQTNVTAGMQINGHFCHKEIITATMDTGAIAEIAVWRARDLNNFPLRIQSPDFTVELSNVRLEVPSSGLFEVPDGFSKYANADLLVDEWIERQARLKKKNNPFINQFEENGETPAPQKPPTSD